MTLQKFFVSLLTLTIITFDIPLAFAQYGGSTECLSDTYNMMAHEQRLYRSVLFGVWTAANAPVSSVRYDKDGNSWLKTDNNTWKTLTSGKNSRGDSEMDATGDVPVRRGLFEIKKASTSDLIPPLTHAFRAFTCRLRAVCDAVQQANGSSDTTVKVQPAGCIEFTETIPNGCRTASVADVSTVSCDQSVDAILDRERALLTLTLAYDAAERTLWQFRGIFESFIADFQFPLLNPLWQTVRAIGALSGQPCFLGQCDK